MLNCDIKNGNTTLEFPGLVVMVIDDGTSKETYALGTQDAETLGLCLIRMAKRIQNGEQG